MKGDRGGASRPPRNLPVPTPRGFPAAPRPWPDGCLPKLAEVRMSHSLRLLALVSSLLVALAVPAHAQSFILHSGDTITPGDIRFTAYPVALFSHTTGPDRWGGA